MCGLLPPYSLMHLDFIVRIISVAEYPNWFAKTAKYNFDVLLQRFIGQDYLRFMQLGAYTGDASAWMLENIFTGKGCRLTDVDTWQGSN